MASYRWAMHRIRDEHGNDHSGPAPISMWWLARAAAEETLQGSPLAAAWLKLFRTHLSTSDTYWLRWRGDFAESAELRRAYSGLYGRFTARALLKEHLGISRFLSLERNGLHVPNGAEVVRTSRGDIPDWLAWDDRNSRYVLAEAKGSLTATDFFSPTGPKCIQKGKEQFERVIVLENGVVVHAARWVAAAKWATDDRKGNPATALWDPPVGSEPPAGERSMRRRVTMTRAWLDSLAPAFGYQNADALLSAQREKESLWVKAKPGPIPPADDWPSEEDIRGLDSEAQSPFSPLKIDAVPRQRARALPSRAYDLANAAVYRDATVLLPPRSEPKPMEGAYICAIFTRFGVRPIRTANDFDALKREQDRARSLEEPAMLVGLTLKMDPSKPAATKPWLDGAGIAQQGELSLLDLRRVDVSRLLT